MSVAFQVALPARPTLRRIAAIALLALASLVPGASLAVDVLISSFTDNPDPAVRGGPITYTITTENTDADTAHDVVVSYPLPANTQFVSVADTVVAGACSHDGATPGVVTCTYPTLLGTLAAPAGPTRTINVVLKTTGATVTTLTSTVTVSTTDIDTNPANNALGQNTTITNGADLSATMTGTPNPATGGGLVTWTVSGSNLGPNTSGPISYTVNLPGVLVYVVAGSGGTGWTCPSTVVTTVTCTRAAQTVGAYPNLAIVTRLTGVSGGTVTLAGNLTSTVGDPDSSNNTPSASITVNPGSDLSVTQDTPTPNPAITGNNVTFVLRPSNLGPNAATAGATVTFPLPTGFTVVTRTGSAGWSCTSSGSPAVVVCNFAGSFASGASGVLTIVATTPVVSTPTPYTGITASIAPNAGGPADPVSSNNSATSSVTVSPDGLDLSLTKTKTPNVVAINATMSSAIVVANAGPRTAASGTIVVTDALDPAFEQYVSASGTSWSCVSAPPNVVCTYNAALGVGNSSTLTIVTRALASGTATNTATTAYSGSPGDYNASNNAIAASASVTDVNNSPDLLTTLVATTAGGVQTTVEAGETALTYTVAVTNQNSTTANAKDIVIRLNPVGRRTTTTVTVATAVTNTSGNSNATFTCTGASPATTGNIACTQATGTVLAPGDIATLTVTTTRPLTESTSVNATASAVSTSQGDPNPADNGAVVAITIDPIADVELVSNNLTAGTVLAGTNATNTVSLRNNGPSPAASMTLVDQFTIPGGDSGFTFVSVTPSTGGSCSGLVPGTSYGSGTPTLTCSWSGATASGTTRTATVIVRPNWQSGATARTLGNTATVSTTTAEDSVGGQGTAIDSRSTTLAINPAQVDLLINNTDSPDPLGFDGVVASNNDVTYTVATTNGGPSLASGTGFTFTMTPPAGKTITFRGDGPSAGVAAANPSGTIAGSLCNQLGSSVTGVATLTVTCTSAGAGQIASGASTTRYLVFRVVSPPSTGGDVYNTNATVFGNETDSNPANDSEGEATTVRVRADLSIAKTPSSPAVQIREPFTWSVVVTNGGPGDSQTTGLTDTLPAGMVFGSTAPTWTKSSAGTGTCTVAGQTTTCTFGQLPANQTVTVTVPARMTTLPGGGTAQNCATATTSEVDPNNTNNLSVCATVAVQSSSLAGTVFQDRDRSGANGGTPQAAAAEPRIASVTVQLAGTDAYGNSVAQTTTTDAGGAYSFTALSPAGASGYTLTETQPGGYVNGPVDPPAPAAGGTYARGGTAGNSSFTAVVLAGNTAGTGYDFPEVRRPTLGGFVYVDLNLNNVRDPATDGPVAGATVRLLNAGTLAVIATTTTASNGAYVFANIDPLIVYTIEEPLPTSPAGLGNGAVNPGLIDGAACASGCAAQPNVPSTATDRIATIDLGAGVDGTAFNFGEQQIGAISGVVFVDSNRDGLRAAGETGRVAGVTLRLVQGADCTAGTTLQSATTTATGAYRFDNVVASQNYLVCETQPLGYGIGSANGVQNSNVIPLVALASGESGNNDFGETLGSIAGSVYQDSGAGTPANANNGVRDAGEPGIPGVTITLTGTDVLGAAVTRSAVTDASGNYLFDALLAPNGAGYSLAEGPVPAGTIDGRDTAGSAGGSTAVNDVIGGIALVAGGQATGYLFGEVPIAGITGTVYIDLDRNGAMGPTPTDGRIAGVTLRLVNGATCGGTLVATATTDASGNYAFTGTPSGLPYTICETQPAGYANGAANPAAGNTSATPDDITIPALPAGGSSGNLFGERLASIGGSVYQDSGAGVPANFNNGVRDAGEPGIAGVFVTLSGTDSFGTAVSRSAVSDAGGNFLFDGLFPSGASGYTVVEGAIPASSGTFANGRDTVGSQGGSAAVVDTFSGIAVPAGVQATGYLFGELPIAPITGTVYIDRDRNGSMSPTPTDGRAAGVTITLYAGTTCGGTVVATTTTDAAGNYSFSGTPIGQTYTLCRTQPTGYGAGPATPASGGTSSGPNAITLTALAPAGSQGNLFAVTLASIAGSVYQDNGAGNPANANNGARNAGEPGIAGVTITASGVDAAGAAVNRSAVTDGNGDFLFADLLAPDAAGYRLAEGPIPSSAGTFANGLDTAGTAGGSTATPDVIGAIAVGAGVPATGYLFGELPVAPLSGTVYLDRDRDGAIGPTPIDGRIAGVTVTLRAGTTCSGSVVATTTTDAAGAYTFVSATVGQTWTVCETQPVGYGNGTANPGAGATSSGPHAITVAALPAAGSTNNDFGERAGSIAGVVFLDANNDGVRQSSDTGIAGVAIVLSGTDAAGTAVSRTAASDPTGAWRFDDLLAAGAGGYALTAPSAQPVVAGVTTLNGLTSAGTSGGSTTAPATSPSVISGITLTAGADSSANRFAKIAPVGLAGSVFVDVNNDGVQTLPGDVGIAGIALAVTGVDDLGGAVSRTIATAADGSYRIADLRPGTYTVTESTQPAGTVNGLTVAGSAGGAATAVTVLPSAVSGIVLTTPGTQATGYRFAELANTGGLSGRVWVDANNDGVVDAGEPGIPGVAIELTGTDASGAAVRRTTTTDATGAYTFDGLAPGTYALREPTQPATTVNGRTMAGTAGGTPTNVATVPSAIDGIVLAAGRTSTGNLFAEVPAAAISGRVYADNNDNGVFDGGEVGLAGVTLTLTGNDDSGAAVNRSAITAADGSYLFDTLRPGLYAIVEPAQPAGTSNGATTVGPLGGTPTARAVMPSAITALTLPPGGQATGNNFAELGISPDLVVSKDHSPARFTVANSGAYRIRVRNAGDVATSGSYTVTDRLPLGIALAAPPTGNGWTCSGATGAQSFSCTSSVVLAPGATAADAISATVAVGAQAATGSPVNNVVVVEGGGESDARKPTAAERDLVAGNPAGLALCNVAIVGNACRDETVVQQAASLSGTVWSDIGNASSLLDGGDRRLPGWQVEVVDPADSRIVGRAVTAADGTYRVADLLPGVAYAVRFRDPQSQVVFGYPVNGEAAPASSGVSCDPTRAIANGTASSCATRSGDPQLTVVLAPGQNLAQQSLPVDPSGVVYDAGVRQPVAGSIVTLAPIGACSGWNPATGIVGATLGGYVVAGSGISMTTGTDGFYQFLFGSSAPASCRFALSVAPASGYTFASTAIPPQDGTLTAPGAAGTTYAVQPQAGPPTGAIGPATAYYLALVTGSAAAEIVHNHIPVDAALPGGLSLGKTGDRQVAEVGDTVRYAVTVQLTSGAAPRQVSVLDRLPPGFTFVKGTAIVNGAVVPDPVGAPGPTLVFNLGAMPPSGQHLLQYRLRVGVGSQQGDGTNRARAHACSVPAGCVGVDFAPLAGSLATNEGRHHVRVSGGVFATEACVVGKIFVDCDGNQIQDAGELGIPGVRLVFQDGTTLISDSEGKYSYCGLPPKSAVLKVDAKTLPAGAVLVPSSNRNLDDAGSLWLDLKNGELHRADFVEGTCTAPVLKQVRGRREQGETRAPTLAPKGAVLRFESKGRRPAQGTADPAATAPGGDDATR